MGLFGNAKERNMKKAQRFYEEALEHYIGEKQGQNLENAVISFREAAERDHVEACRALGWIYLYEELYPHDLEEAIRWYEKGVALDDMECAFNLAIVYCNEIGVRDYEKAFALFSKVAAKGNAEAAYYRAQFLRSGIGTSRNEEEAVRWYEKAHQVGHPDAAEELACLWEERTIALDAESEMDCKRGAKLLHAAARWHEKAAQAANDDQVRMQRRQRAEECQAAAEEYRHRAEKIRQAIHDAWMSVPEPADAYRILLGADYSDGGQAIMDRLQEFVKQHLDTTEGAREGYQFFWFENSKQKIEVMCYHRLEKATAKIQKKTFVPDRLIPILPYDSGMTEDIRVCIENCLAAGCTSILPLVTSNVTKDWEDEELGRLIRQDLLSFAKGNGAKEEVQTVRARLVESEDPAEWCIAALDANLSWWEMTEKTEPVAELDAEVSEEETEANEADAAEEALEDATEEEAADEESEETAEEESEETLEVAGEEIQAEEHKDLVVEVDHTDEDVLGEMGRLVSEVLETDGQEENW